MCASSTPTYDVYDTHCHYEGYWREADFSELISKARAMGFKDAVTCAHDAFRFEQLRNFCRQFDLSYALGVHPFEWEDQAALLEKFFCALDDRDSRCVAVGEIGLDFSERRRLELWPNIEPEIIRQKQTELFETQLDAALCLNLPVSVHAFGAMEAVRVSLRKFSGVTGVIHAFNGSYEQAQEFVRLGFKLGFGGTLTYAGSKKIRRVFAELSSSDWVLETDAPWIPSAPRRELEPNTPFEKILSTPADIFHTVRAAAQILNSTENDVRRQACQNSLSVFSALKT